jgi:hypothetical protein
VERGGYTMSDTVCVTGDDGLDLDALVKATKGHTPGPWGSEVWEGARVIWVLLDDDGPMFTVNADATEADVQLVLAAPALLAECVRLREQLARCDRVLATLTRAAAEGKWLEISAALASIGEEPVT